MPNFKIDGVVPIIPTPFTPQGKLDIPAMGSLLEFAVRGNACAVCLPAYASEFYKLSDGERRELPLTALEYLRGRLPVIAQVNHVSVAQVREVASELERAGVSAISVAVPRLFGMPEADLLRYFSTILGALSIPVVIQDFNPGGATVSVEFTKSLHRQHPNFAYLKLEEPLMAGRVCAILDATSGGVGVLDGWGGTYLMELIDAGISGVMPALGVSDILQVVWKLARAGQKEAAFRVFQGVLPQILYSLQNLEFFHHAEKSLLVQRGVLAHAFVRDATLTVHPVDRAHLDFLNRKIVELALTLPNLGISLVETGP